jgi:hypothetical protein
MPPSLAHLSPDAAQHFRLRFFVAVTRVIESAAEALDGNAPLVERFPFLAGYRDELAANGFPADGGDDEPASYRLEGALATWEERTPAHLPLRALARAARLDPRALGILFTVGLVEEDARFGLLFEAMQGTAGVHRPTQGLLDAWWRDPDDRGEARAALRSLRDLGLLAVENPEAPRSEWLLHVPARVWEAIRGEVPENVAPGMCHRRPPDEREETLLVPEALRETAERLPALLRGGEVGALVVRGPRHGGRRTFVRAMAAALGRGVVEVHGPLRPDDERWRLAGLLSTLLHAMPVAVLDLAPGETAVLPAAPGADGPVAVVLGRQGGAEGAALERALTVALSIPGPAERRAHWSRALRGRPCREVDRIADGFRMTSGAIRRAAGLAGAEASLEGREEVTAGDVRRACGSLRRAALDTLAVRIATVGGWGQLAASPETMRELHGLEARCRHRERLGGAVGPALGAQLNPGVRALLHGPSGCGKTLAARVLAGVLERDLYAVNLAGTVDKYLGETEKNLDRVFSLAEELDVVLLLDEGDSLLARRTQVSSSNDRFANLETNYLLQRVECFEGILVVCTNGIELLEPALMRRMDFTVGFRLPDPAERFAVLRLHLPDRHEIDHDYLREVASRCQLSPGQLRNAVLHASLLALSDAAALGSTHLDEGVQREYRKAGATCPLRPLERG